MQSVSRERENARRAGSAGVSCAWYGERLRGVIANQQSPLTAGCYEKSSSPGTGTG